jgi:hypothetical protein
MEFEAIEPEIEINGKVIYSSVAAFPMARCLPAKILVRKGLGKSVNKKFQIDTNDWYSLRDWVDALNEMSLRFGDDALIKIGMKIPEIIPFPVPAKDMESALKLLEIVYHMNHRKNGRTLFDPNSGVILERIGHYSYTRNENEYTINLNESSYPCALAKGLLTAIARKIEPNSIVIHDDSTSCCKRGDKFCTFKVRL